MEASEADDGAIRVEVRGATLLMGIDRVAKRNGFTPRMFEELGHAYTRLETDPALRVGLLHGLGDHFCAGIDLPKMAEHRAAGRPSVPLNLVDPLATRAPFRTKPVVVAMQGVCFTIALELMMAADIAVAASNCRFAQMEASRGVMPGCGGTYRLVQRLGWGEAMRWLLTGEEFGADQARAYGLVQEVVEPGAQFDRALALCERIARQAPQSIASILESARLALGPHWMMAATLAAAENNRLFLTEDAAEGRRAFAEKRDPLFTGA